MSTSKNNKPKKEEVQAPAEPAHFLSFIGGNFYTKESFINEAATLGVSRRMPSHHIPADLVCGKSRIYVATGGERKAGSEKPMAEVFGYFVPNAVEFIASTDGKPGKMYAEVIASLKLRPDSRIIDTIHGESQRGCGYRKEGGTYIVVDKADTPLVVLDKPVNYIGNHFRGLMRLTSDEANKLEVGHTFGRLVEEECMFCGAKMYCAPDGHARADRERRRVAKGGEAKWTLTCEKCRKGKIDEDGGSTHPDAKTDLSAKPGDDESPTASEPKLEPKLEPKPVTSKVAKPVCKLLGTDGNVFAIIGSVSRALKKANLKERASEFSSKAMSCHNYEEVLNLCFDYVEVQ